MESGKTAVVIIIVAMMLTAGVGYFANFSQKDSVRTEYNMVGSLDAFMSANSSPTPQSELFNSTYNIVGWNGDIDTTNTVLPDGRTNQYVYKEESSDYISFNLPYNFGMRPYMLSGSYSGVGGNESTNWTSEFFKTSLSDTQNVYMYSGSILPNTDHPTPGLLYTRTPSTHHLTEYGTAIGGYGQSTHFEVGTTANINTDKTLSITFNGQNYSSSGCFIADINDVISNTPLWIVTAGGKLAYDENHAPMVYDSESQASAEENEYRELYPNKTWSHRRMTMEDFSDNIRLYINQSNIAYVGDYEINYNWSHSESGIYRTVTGSLDITGRTNSNIAYLQYKPTTQHWYAYSNNSNVALWDSDTVGVYTTDGSNMAFQMQLQMKYVIPAVYFDPTRYMGIDGTAVWSNYDFNQSMINTEIVLLWKGTGDIQVNNAVGPILKIVEDSNTYSVQVSSGNYVTLGAYKGLEITLDVLSNVAHIRGILNEQVNADNIPSTYDYIPSSVVYTVKYYDENTEDELIPTVPGEIYRLTFNSVSGYAYILNTYILTDPNNLLWTDVDINLEDYFTDYKDNMRILFQGFVSYGDSLTINGQFFEIDNSGFDARIVKIVKPEQGIPGTPSYVPAVTETQTVRFNLNGLAVDYYNNHCHLVQTNGKNTVDLGEITDYTIQMDGTWYFSSSISTIAVVPSKENVWNPGWDMDMNTAILLFVGMIIILTSIVLMRFRDMIDLSDIAILICSVIIPMTLVVM